MYAPLDGTLVIGLGYKARHGKDQAARFIQQTYTRLDIERFAHGDAIKALCRTQWGMTTKDGPLLQRVGSAMRDIDPEIWLRTLYWTIAERRPTVALITDVRFPNETALVKAMGGFVVKVERRLADGSLYRVADRDPDHVTETGLDGYTDWDAVVPNPEGQLDVFRDHVLCVFHALSARAGLYV